MPKAWLGHIGVAVTKPAQLKKLFSILGIEMTSQEEVPDQKVMTHFLPVTGAHTAYVELLEPTGSEGTIAGYIADRKKGGIHHLAFQVQQGTLDELSTELKQAGFQLIYEAARPGAHGMRVNFIHPKTADGVLIELMEGGHE